MRAYKGLIIPAMSKKSFLEELKSEENIQKEYTHTKFCRNKEHSTFKELSCGAQV